MIIDDENAPANHENAPPNHTDPQSPNTILTCDHCSYETSKNANIYQICISTHKLFNVQSNIDQLWPNFEYFAGANASRHIFELAPAKSKG